MFTEKDIIINLYYGEILNFDVCVDPLEHLDTIVDSIYDYINYYDDGSRVRDVDGHILPKISHRAIEGILLGHLKRC